MARGHRGGAGSGNPDQGPGKRRGPETGNGYTASTGRGRPSGVVYQSPGTVPGQKSRLRTIADVLTGKHRKP
jgi:hypothetical protein